MFESWHSLISWLVIQFGVQSFLLSSFLFFSLKEQLCESLFPLLDRVNLSLRIVELDVFKHVVIGVHAVLADASQVLANTRDPFLRGFQKRSKPRLRQVPGS
eukprot:m.784549 g.784549  ORF g.784549 m.784549 type:complete len:102 (+) comp59156_c0_seq38:425-730(+)